MPSRIQDKRAELEPLQVTNLSRVPSRDSLEMEQVVHYELKALLAAEESFLRQKSRVLWVQEGDQNSRFFHSMIAVKQNKQAVRAINIDQGQRLEGIDQIATEAVNFFQKLLGVRNEYVVECPISFLKELLGCSFSVEAKQILHARVTREETKAFMFAQNSDKAPGPDGYTSEFFKKNGESRTISSQAYHNHYHPMEASWPTDVVKQIRVTPPPAPPTSNNHRHLPKMQLLQVPPTNKDQQPN
ncbi:hypothetical protein V6N13_125673 [Hibiscus sabdariffa]